MAEHSVTALEVLLLLSSCHHLFFGTSHILQVSVGHLYACLWYPYEEMGHNLGSLGHCFFDLKKYNIYKIQLITTFNKILAWVKRCLIGNHITFYFLTQYNECFRSVQKKTVLNKIVPFFCTDIFVAKNIALQIIDILQKKMCNARVL